MLVVHFVRAPDRPEINRIGISENFKPLMDKYIVDEEVRKPVYRNAQANPEQVIESLVQADGQTGNARRGEDDKKIVILFEEIPIVTLVVIMVQKPQKTVHQVLMRQPGDTFHADEGGCYYERI